MDKKTALKILDYMEKKVLEAEDPRELGKALTGILGGLWRYRVGDYRIICEIQNDKLKVLVLKVGHRKEIYH